MINVSSKMSDMEKSVYETYKDKFPFQVFEFADEIGVNVYSDSELPINVSGMISKAGDTYDIVLNPKHNINRMRFTLAHELSHYFNDKDYLESVGEIQDTSMQATKRWLFRDDGTLSDPKIRGRDIYANQFAAELLMPEDAFIKKWQECYSAEQVARYFEVSNDAVRIRASLLLGEIV